MVISSAINISLFAGVLCIAVAYLVVQYIRDGIASRKELLIAVHPLHTANDDAFTASDPIIDFTTTKANVSSDSSIRSDQHSNSDESLFECKDADSSISPDSIQFSEISVGTNDTSDYLSISDDNESTKSIELN